jgi:hypothetical protein
MFPAPSFAQEAASQTAAQEEHRALARRFVSIGGAEAVFVEGAIRGFEAAVQRGGVTLTAQQLARLRPILDAAFQEPARVYVDEMTAYFSQSATASDMEAAVTYYESETGQVYAAAVVELVMALALFDASGGQTSLPSAPEESSFDPAELAVAQRLGAAFLSRLSELERERLAAGGIEAGDFTKWMARFIASRLEPIDVAAAVRWAESAESRRLEGPSAERAAAEELAALRAVRALDTDRLRSEFEAVMRENPA